MVKHTDNPLFERFRIDLDKLFKVKSFMGMTFTRRFFKHWHRLGRPLSGFAWVGTAVLGINHLPITDQPELRRRCRWDQEERRWSCMSSFMYGCNHLVSNNVIRVRVLDITHQPFQRTRTAPAAVSPSSPGRPRPLFLLSKRLKSKPHKVVPSIHSWTANGQNGGS